jgi:glutathione S-transferase
MKLYHFPSPNPQKITFALEELGVDCELVPVDLIKREQAGAEFQSVNPFGRVPVLVDGDLVLPESQAILAYLGDKTGRLWPRSPGGRAEALKWLFYLSQHIMPSAGDVALRIRARLLGAPVDEAAVKRGEDALQAPMRVLDAHLGVNTWMLGSDFSLVDCAYCPVLNVLDKAAFSFAGFSKVAGYLDASRARPAWRAIPKLPALA